MQINLKKLKIGAQTDAQMCVSQRTFLSEQRSSAFNQRQFDTFALNRNCATETLNYTKSGRKGVKRLSEFVVISLFALVWYVFSAVQGRFKNKFKIEIHQNLQLG